MTGAAGVPHSTTRSGEVMDRKWWTLIAVCFGTFMLLLDITVVNVALPDIQQSLHSSFADLQWVIDAYALTLAAFLLTAGVVGDIFGRRGVFAIGLAIFTAVLTAVRCCRPPRSCSTWRGRPRAWAAPSCSPPRSPSSPRPSRGRERGTAFGVYGAVVGGAVAVGPLIGGAITSGIGWRWIFFVNLPIGIVAIAITLTKVAAVEGPHPPPHRLDRLRRLLRVAVHAGVRPGAGERARAGAAR